MVRPVEVTELSPGLVPATAKIVAVGPAKSRNSGNGATEQP